MSASSLSAGVGSHPQESICPIASLLSLTETQSSIAVCFCRKPSLHLKQFASSLIFFPVGLPSGASLARISDPCMQNTPCFSLPSTCHPPALGIPNPLGPHLLVSVRTNLLLLSSRLPGFSASKHLVLKSGKQHLTYTFQHPQHCTHFPAWQTSQGSKLTASVFASSRLVPPS